MLTKLTITVDDDAVDEARGLYRTIVAQFNPSELSFQKSAQIAEQNIPGLDSPLQQFVRGQTEKLTVELTLDEGSRADDEMSVPDRMKALYQLVKVQPTTHAVPLVTLSWGALMSFRAVVESVQRRMTLMDQDGTLLRAVVTLAFREYRTLEEQLKELNPQSSDHTHVVVVREGDRLDTIAHREYGDADLWRELAGVNRVRDPRDVEPGTTLRIPPRNMLPVQGRATANGAAS